MSGVSSTWWGGNNFSTDEQVVGKWIDGKPIYQKTFTGLHVSVSNSMAWINMGVSISNGSKILECWANADGLRLCVCNAGIDSTTGNITVTIAAESLLNGTRVITDLIVWYTKTTD